MVRANLVVGAVSLSLLLAPPLVLLLMLAAVGISGHPEMIGIT